MNEAWSAQHQNTGAVPLSAAQLGLWYAQQAEPGNPLFNTAQVVRIEGPLERDRFKAAVDAAMGEADGWAVAITPGERGPTQRILDANRAWLQLVDCSAARDPLDEARRQMEADRHTILDLGRDPLARNVLFDLGQERFAWYQRAHHLVTDGYATALVNRRIAELYANPKAGTPLAPWTLVASEEARYGASEQPAKDAAFWRATLDAVPEELGMAVERRAPATHFLHTERLVSGPALAALHSLAEATNSSWPDALTALVAAYCQRFAPSGEIVAGVPHMGRFGSPLARVAGLVMNVLPLRVDAAPATAVVDYLQDTAKSLLRARRHGRYRSEQMRRDLGLIGGGRRLYGPMINVLPFDGELALAGLTLATTVLSTGPVDDISFTLRGDGRTQLRLSIEAHPGRYRQDEIAAHGERLLGFLAAAPTAATLGEIELVTPAEHRHLIWGVNDTDHPVPATTLAALIEAQLARSPDAVAVVFGGTSLSYAELDRRSAALARQLQERGAGRERIVALALPRSLELIVALVAILRAGAAYLPLDPEHPPERLRAVVAEAQPVALLAEHDLAACPDLPALVPADWAETGAPGPGALSDDMAYVIFTSGSTGRPKGVVIEHRAIVNRLEWMRQHYGFSPADRVLQKTPMSFDVSVWEFFLPLLAGATLVVAPPEAHRDPAAIAALVREHAITALHFVPSMLARFLLEPASAGLRIARVFASGEALPAELCTRFHARIVGELHNLYGPTEAAVDVSYWPVPAGATDTNIPIGRPVWNTRLYVLDDRLRPVPAGMAGELYLGGVQLARGYLGRPELTGERFLPDPFRPGERIYRSGDIALRRADGAVVYLGRADHQVKIRGLRIELGEIEAVAAASGLVREVVVLDREDRAGDRKLVAYCVPAGPWDEAALRTALARQLPQYMLPAALVPLDSLPVTTNGKLDRKALPAPVFAAPAMQLPTSELEQLVARLFAQTLGLETPLGLEADFFALGGDSLSALNLLLAIRQELDHDPGLGGLMQHPTIGGLAQRLEADRRGFDSGLGPLIKLGAGAPDKPPLFVVHPAGGLAWCYRDLARALGPRRGCYGLQAPALDPAVPIAASLDELAADYVERILALELPGPIHLLGWSVGGLIAQAMAVRLVELGHQPGLVAMLDSYPSECWRAQAEPTPTQAVRALLAIAGYDAEAYPELTTRLAILDFLRAGDSPLGRLPPEGLDGVTRVVLQTNRLVREHHHRPYAGTLTHIRAALDHIGRPLRPELWAPYARDLDCIAVPFLHPQLAGAAATALIAPELIDRLDSIDRERLS